ncbi:MAG: hypothetical protein ACI865_000580 [Flavobacteriaceae bacterium]|jgi:hypothetical protein
MKHFTYTLLFALIGYTSYAQAPARMTYQAVVRDAGGSLVTNSTVGAQYTILQGSVSGTAVFIEWVTVLSNANGLITHQIGSSTAMNIDWSLGPYYVKVEIDPTGGTSFTSSSTSQFLSVPYALYAETAEFANGADYTTLTNAPANVSAFTNDAGYITSPNDADSDPTNEIQSLQLIGQDLTISGSNTVTLPGSSGNTLDQAYDQGGSGVGRVVTIDAGEVEFNTATASGIAVRAENTNTGVAIIANTTNAANTFSAIQSSTNSSSSAASAIIGNSTGAAWGVSGQVSAGATAQSAIYGSNLRTAGGHGVYGIGFNGVVGETNQSTGNAVYGENFDAILPLGNGIGVAGKGYYGVVGEDRYLGGVAGAYGVFSNGDLAATGVKTFIIDHPLDPENKVLRHFSMESDEVLNVYRGNAVLDDNGEVIVSLPDYYDEINKNPSYNLTAIGGFSQLYIKEEISDGKFIIGGGTSGLKVSWTVYSERNDPYLRNYPENRAVELEKREGQKGKYFMPQLYDQPADKKIFPSENKLKAVQPIIELQD